MSDLFRSEAVNFQRTRMEGEVFLALRFHWLLVGLLCSAMVIILISCAFLITYTTKIEAKGRVHVDEKEIELISSTPVLINEIYFEPGQYIRAGDRILDFNSIFFNGSQVSDPSSIVNPNCDYRSIFSVKFADYFDVALEEGSCVLTSSRDLILVSLKSKEDHFSKSGDTIIRAIAVEDPILIEIFVPVQSVGFVKVGTPVFIRYDSFSDRKFGRVAGTVSSVDLSSSNSSSTDMSHPLFKVTVAVEKNYFLAYGEKLPLREGMSLSADILIREQSAIEWFFDSFFAIEDI